MLKPIIPFFTDENVPDSVGQALVLAKHEVARLRDWMPPGSKDPLVALTAWSSDRGLVSHDNDFKKIAEQLGVAKRMLREKMHRIHLRCPEPKDAARLMEAMSVIENEWAIARHTLKPMVIEIHESSIRLLR